MAIVRPKLKFIRGKTYVIDQSDTTNAGHPLRFTADSGVSEYTSGVTATGTPGQAGAKTTFAVPGDAPDNLMYYCSTHGINMGQKMKIIGTVPATVTGGEGVYGSSITHGQWRNPTDSTTTSAQIYIRQTVVGGNSQSTAAVNLRRALNNLQVGDTITVASPAKVFTISGGISTFLDTNTDYRVWLFDVDAQGLTNSTYFYEFTIPAAPDPTWFGARGLIAGGYTAAGTQSNSIEYINISTPGNALDFGDLTQGRYNGASMSNGTKAAFGGGIVTNYSNVIDYVTVATPGNAIDFGDMTSNGAYTASEGDGTYGIMFGGLYASGGNVIYKEIEYITIDTPGNAISFANLNQNQTGRAMGTNGTIGVIATGNDGSGSAYSNTMSTITMATPGNAVVSSGTLLDSWTYVQNLPGDNTYLLVGAGRRSNGEASNGWTNMVEKFATATQTGATDHGDLTNYGGMSAASSDGTYAFWAGREGSQTAPSGQSGGRYHTIEQMSISTGGNSTDFGTISNYIEAGFGSSGNAA